MTPEIDILNRKIEREKKARLQAEMILEQKASELYVANERLRQWNESLEKEIKQRTLELRESEEKYRGIIENMELGLLEVDNDDIITKAYNHFCQMVGYNETELIGKKAASIFIDEELQNVIVAHNEKRKEGVANVYEIPLKTKDGTMLWALISGAPIHNLEGEVVGSIGIHYNISDKKKLIEELALAKQISEDARVTEKQFLANMSHEIRTPLNAIIGMAHLLYDTQPTPEQREFLDVLKNSSNFLHSLISDILDISKIEAGQTELVLKEIDIVGLVKTHQKALGLRLEERPIKIEAMIDSQLEGYYSGDELFINQILNNLLSNAEKFTVKGVISITVKQIKRQEDDVVLEFQISDTGMGIDDTQIGFIFQKFKQVNLRDNQKTKGTGLGLAIVKELVELMGGNITVKSQRGVGTTFTFTLPLEKTNSVKIVSPLLNIDIKNLSTTLHEMNILVVEDNLMNRKYLGTLLEKWAIKTSYAFNGREALPIVQSQKFDLILMDIQMPIMNGYETTIAIRNTLSPNQFTPIIALTASAMSSERNRAFEVGMDDFLSKPFTPVQLQEKLTKYHSENIYVKEILTNISSSPNTLDEISLTQMYGDDNEYAADMFLTFIQEVLPEVKTLDSLVNHPETLKMTLHRLKPTFSMVGLSEIGIKVAELEKYINEKTLKKDIEEKLTIISTEMETFIPIIEQRLSFYQSN